MNAAEHFAKAERWLVVSEEADIGSDEERYGLAAAQVHATLALAAATSPALTRTSPLIPRPVPLVMSMAVGSCPNHNIDAGGNCRTCGYFSDDAHAAEARGEDYLPPRLAEARRRFADGTD